jgi:NAD(P)-dependent dehydrogenase (short-subunit alcohol dehydrogenase family)
MSIVIITGSSTGIGFATALNLARAGHRVYATMRNPQKFPGLLELAKKEQLPIQVLAMDVDSDSSVKNAIHGVISREGQIDVLVNNAGIAVNGSVEELTLAQYKAVMETNYFGTIRCIQEVLPLMRKRRSGCIINVTSVAGKIFGHFHSAYCATKAAVEALSECLAQEVFSFNVRIAVVEPGVIETPIFGKSNEIPSDTQYPKIKRLKAFFAASLENHVAPSTVAAVIQDIVEGKSDKFRNPAGPDALPLLQWRASVPDEKWISAHDIDDETWIENQEQYLHLNVRSYM